MHSISPYSVRCFNPRLPGKLPSDKYCPLDKIGSSDLFDLLKKFITIKTGGLSVIPSEKQVYRFSNVKFSLNTREIYGWLDVGTYGMKSEIINIEDGKVEFRKGQKNADIIKHYFHFFLPAGLDEGICILHNYRNIGVKTLFYDEFSLFFSKQTSLPLRLLPLSYDKAMQAWANANTKELRVLKYSGISDKADQLKGLGHNEHELTIKPQRKKDFGKLKSFFVSNSTQAEVVEVLQEMGSEVKAVVVLNGSKRTFIVGQDASNSVCRIEVDENVEQPGGAPKLSSMKTWVRVIINEYCTSIYKGMGVGV